MSHKNKHQSTRSGHHPHRSFKFKAVLFSIYLLIFLIIFAWLDYYAYEFYNPLPFILISVALAVIATYLHVRRGTRSEVDDLADKL